MSKFTRYANSIGLRLLLLKLRFWRVAAGILLCAIWMAASLLPGCNGKSETAQPNEGGGDRQQDVEQVEEPDVAPVSYKYEPPSSGGYVGSEACAECHEQLFASYQQHPMYRSTLKVADDPNAPMLTRDESRVSGGRFSHEIESTSEAMIHHEVMYDQQGELIYDHAMPMDYVVGSGRRAKAYLFQDGDSLFMSPLNWYTSSGSWGHAPDYQDDDPRRFSRRAVDICIGCHAGRMHPVGRGADRFEEQPFAEMAIGCERCHGPGESHVDWHNRSDHPAGEVDPIVNPMRLGIEEQHSVCFQCHLQPSSSRVLRHGRTDLDFRPGDKLSHIWTVLRSSGGIQADGRTESVRHVQQMMQSQCFVQSNQALTCTSCHDPHRVPQVDERIEFYRDRCFQCHQDSSCEETRERRDAQSDSCIACHMPARETTTMAHVSQTDHRVIRRIDQRIAAPAATLTERFFPGHEEALDELEQERAWILGSWQSGRRLEVALLPRLEALTDVFPEDGELLLALGTMCWEQNRIAQAVECYERARRQPGTAEAATSTLMQIAYSRQHWPKLMEYADAMIALNPNHAIAHALRGDALASLGRLPEGVESTERAVQLNPPMVEMREWLIRAYDQLGQEEEKAEQATVVERMRNASTPQSTNQGE